MLDVVRYLSPRYDRATEREDMMKKIIGVGSKIMITNGDVNYLCKVYEIQKASMGGLKIDYIVIDEAIEESPTKRGKK